MNNVIIEGALDGSSEKSVSHFRIIKKIMYPKIDSMKTIYGMNSKKKSLKFLK